MSAPDLVPPGTTGGGTPVGGSGTIGTVPKWATTTTLGDSVITESGANVGIGTASPGRLLTASVSNAGGTINTGTAVVRVVNASYASADNRFCGVHFAHTDADAQVTGAIGTVLTSTAVAWAGDMVFGVKSSATASVLTEYMRIQAGGNVGIGTTSPTAPLHVAGDVIAYPTTGVYGQLEVTGKTTPTHRLAIGYNSTDNCGFIQSVHDATAYKPLLLNPSGGNVGIGTTSPGYLLTVAGVLAFDSGYGSAAPAYGCRAWINFNGTGVVAIRASGNVSTITDLAVGNYQINYTTPMVDVNYAVFSAVGHPGGAGTPLYTTIDATGAAPPTAAAVRILTLSNANAQVDAENVYVTVSR